MSESNISLRADITADTFHLPSGSDTGTASAPASLSVNAAKLLQWIFSFPALMGSLLVGAVFYAGRSFQYDPDLWWHLKVGETILSTHRWPTTDPYSFTVLGHPWIAHEWLGDVLFAAVYRIAGIQGLDALLIVIGSAVVLAVYALATLRTSNSKAGFTAATILLPFTTVSFSMRPQMLSYLFLILTLIALERFCQGKPGMLWFLPVLMVVWVNTHGLWIVGLGAIFIYWMSGLAEFKVGDLEAHRWTSGERIRLSSVFLLCLLALPITPYGTRITTVPFELASLPLAAEHIREYQSMPFHLLGGEIFLGLILGMILILVMFRFKWRLEELLLFLSGLAMACLHVRFLLVFVPFFAPSLAMILALWISGYDRAKDKFALNAALMICVVVALIHYFPTRAELQQRVAEQSPVSAVDYMKHHPVPGPMFNTWDFGAYLLWARGPEQKVFIDGRSEVYEKGGSLFDYLYITRLQPGALAVLNGYGIKSCLLARNEALATVLSASPGWRRVYFDKISAIFVRTEDPGKLTTPSPAATNPTAALN